MTQDQGICALATGVRHATLLALIVLALTTAALAQSATIYGSLGNFDVVNHIGKDAHGLEIELEGLSSGDVYYTFSYQRYGSPQILAYSTGVRVRWASSYDGATSRFAETTVPHAPNTPFAGSCYMGGLNYTTSGCEHFGVSLRANAAKTTYRWLVEDPQSPGTLIPEDPPIAIASPSYQVLPPARPGNPPVLEVEVDAPEPAEAPELYGNAQWMKIFVTQLTREVTLDELLTCAVTANGRVDVGAVFALIPNSGGSGGGGTSVQANFVK